MRELGFVVLLLSISPCLAAAGACKDFGPSSDVDFNETISRWVNQTLSYVRCVNKTLPLKNISLAVCSRGTPGGCPRRVTLKFNSTVATCPHNCTALVFQNCGTQTTANPTTPARSKYSNEQLNEYVNKIEEKLQNINKSDTSDKNNIFVVVKNVTPGEPLYKSTDAGTAVDSIVLDNIKDLDRVVINDLKQDNLLNADPVISNQSTYSGERIFGYIFGDRLLAMAAFSKTGAKMNVAKVKFSIDMANGNMNKVCEDAKEEAGKVMGPTYRSYCKEPMKSCAFFHEKTWPSNGCKVIASDDKTVGCECNHTTVFAVLLSSTVVTVPQSVKTISLIAQVTTIVFLSITVFLLAKVRNRVRGDRAKVQIGVASSLLCLHLVTVWHDLAIRNDVACRAVAVLTHYFLLCTALWMLMEGLTLLVKTMDIMMRIMNGKNSKNFSIFRYVFSFSVPLVIVGISAAIGFSNDEIPYMPKVEEDKEYEQCFVGESFRVPVVIIPIAIILFCCLLIIGRMFYVVFRMSSESENYKPTSQRRQTTSSDFVDLVHVKAALKATLVLVPILGISWIIGFLSGRGEVFMYIQAVVNGLQGIAVFFVYCVVGKEVRKAILSSYARKMYTFTGSFEFASKQRRMTSEQSSNMAHATLSTNVGDNFSDGDCNSIKSADVTTPTTAKL